jgi:hypothetical protein
MSDKKRTYAAEILRNKPLKLRPAANGKGGRKKAAGLTPDTWKLPCSVETIYRLIERIQEL